MTTVVYDHKNKQIAVDSRTTGGNLINSDEAIKYAYHKNQIWFFCGACCDNERLLGMQHDEKPEPKPDCSAIMVDGDRAFLVSFNGEYCAHTKLDYSFSIGSGGDFALAALDHGKTAKEAVNYAKTRDTGTGGKVRVYDIKTAKFI